MFRTTVLWRCWSLYQDPVPRKWPCKVNIPQQTTNRLLSQSPSRQHVSALRRERRLSSAQLNSALLSYIALSYCCRFRQSSCISLLPSLLYYCHTSAKRSDNGFRSFLALVDMMTRCLEGASGICEISRSYFAA